jgi:hypothetical protein
MGSFFSSLKTEQTAGKNYRTRAEAKTDVFDHIERFHNSSDGIRPYPCEVPAIATLRKQSVS